MLMGENSRTVSQRVAEKMVEVNRSLPPGVTASTVYDRMNLVDKTIATVRRNLTEGALLVNERALGAGQGGRYLLVVGGGDVVPEMVQEVVDDLLQRCSAGAPVWKGIEA